MTDQKGFRYEWAVYKHVFSQSFQEMAYTAEEKQDLLDAINSFLDESIVLPPGEWDKETLLPIMDMARKKKLAKKKKDEEKASGYLSLVSTV